MWVIRYHPESQSLLWIQPELLLGCFEDLQRLIVQILGAVLLIRDEHACHCRPLQRNRS
jgi:hypothetical protein